MTSKKKASTVPTRRCWHSSRSPIKYPLEKSNLRVFFSLSSGYSCRIFSYMHAHPPNTRTPHNTPHVQTNLQLHSDVRSRNRVHLEITGRFRRRRARRNPFVAPHVRGCRLQLEIVKGNYCSRVRHQRRNQASNAGGQVAHQRS